MPRAVANVAVWISVRHLTRAQHAALLRWQESTECYPVAGNASGCPEDGRGFLSGAYSGARAALLMGYLAEQRIRVMSKP